MGTVGDKLTYLDGTKTAIKEAIIDKGVEVEDTDSFRSYATKIGQISGGGGNYQEKTVMPTQQPLDVTPDNGYDALSSVHVNGSVGLVPSNIKLGQSIFGVSGTYSGDLSVVGSTATIEGMSPIGKGQRFYGIPNTAYSQQTLGTSYLNMTSTYKVSDDFKVRIKHTAISTSTTSVQIEFWDETNSQYVVSNIPLNDSWVGENSTDVTLNEDGTLAMFLFVSSTQTATQATLVLEIDKINKTATPYIVAMGTDANNPYTLRKKYLILWKTIYRYNISTHNFTKLNGSYEYFTISDYATHQSAWANSNTYVYYASTSFRKLCFDDGNNSFGYSVGSNVEGTAYMNNTATMFVSVTSMGYNFYSLNPVDLTFELIATYSRSLMGQTYNLPGYLYENFMIAGNKIYNITNVASDVPTVLYTHGTNLTPTLTKAFNIHKFYITNYMCHYPNGSTAQYLAYYQGSNAMQSGRVYGIVSEAVDMGQITTAQTLFNL